jgi:hypothetical protein
MRTRASLGWSVKKPGLLRMAKKSATHPPPMSHQFGVTLPPEPVVPLTNACQMSTTVATYNAMVTTSIGHPLITLFSRSWVETLACADFMIPTSVGRPCRRAPARQVAARPRCPVCDTEVISHRYRVVQGRAGTVHARTRKRRGAPRGLLAASDPSAPPVCAAGAASASVAQVAAATLAIRASARVVTTSAPDTAHFLPDPREVCMYPPRSCARLACGGRAACSQCRSSRSEPRVLPGVCRRLLWAKLCPWLNPTK